MRIVYSHYKVTPVDGTIRYCSSSSPIFFWRSLLRAGNDSCEEDLIC